MPKSLEKTRKQIQKKRHGKIDGLHQYSRDSKRLHKAQVRDERIEKLAAARKKHDQPLSTECLSRSHGQPLLTGLSIAVDRAKFFQKAAQDNDGQAFDMDKMQKSISQSVLHVSSRPELMLTSSQICAPV